ncbi:MAG: shikimate dehydrogenase [Candidatus Jordarchaeales archaeon]
MIGGRTRVVGIIGDPVEHSLSPRMHNAAFEHLKLDYVYVPFRVSSNALKEAIEGVRALNIKGVNVTIPHKVSVIPLLDWVDEEALNIGAVNTIVSEKGELKGYNTDGLGFLEALKEEGVKVSGIKAVLLGAGGAARAIAYSLAPIVSELVILNRTADKAISLSEELRRKGWSVRGGRLDEETLEKELKDTELLVNATSVGMYPNVDETPVPREVLNSRLTVFDAVYNPIETRLLKDAKSVGAKVVNGVGMLVNQGAVAFKLWTGVNPPKEVMRRAVIEGLQSSGGV